MAVPLQKLTTEAQQVLDDLWRGKLIPFALKVGKLTQEPPDDPRSYLINFYDSRIGPVKVPMTEGASFSQVVRSAVLEAAKKLSGPLG